MPIGVTEAVKAATEIAKTISSIVDQNKRRKFEQAAALLNSTQQRQLNEQLASAKDENEKIEILSNSLTQYLIASAMSSSKKDTTLFIVAGSLSVLLLAMIIVFSIKNKKSL